MNTYYAYIRVSTVKQGEQGSSLEAQRAAIEAYAARHKFTISAWFTEIETAAKQGRTVFNRMIAQATRRRVAGIIIHKIDRSARNLKDWARLGELSDRGIQLHFAHESLDLATRGGRLAADIQAVVAADFIRNLREETRKGFYARLRQGLYPLQAPRGYLDMGRGKAKAVDPVTAPLVREAFEQYASGDHSLDTLRAHLALRGLAAPSGRPMSRHAIATMLRNPFYIGIIRLYKTDEIFAGVHQPIILKSLFDEVQARLDGRVFARTPGDPLLFRRFIKCAACGLSLIGERQKSFVYYRCHTPACRGTCIRSDTVETYVQSNLALLQLSAVDDGDLGELLESLIAEDEAERPLAHQNLERDLALTKEHLARLTDAYIDNTIDRDTYNDRKEALILRRASLIEQRDAAPTRSPWRDIREKLALGQNALDRFVSDSPAGKLDVLRNLTSNLVARGKHLEIRLYSPFQEIAEWVKNSDCDPDRPEPRTMASKRPPDAPCDPNRPEPRTMASIRPSDAHCDPDRPEPRNHEQHGSSSSPHKRYDIWLDKKRDRRDMNAATARECSMASLLQAIRRNFSA